MALTFEGTARSECTKVSRTLRTGTSDTSASPLKLAAAIEHTRQEGKRQADSNLDHAIVFLKALPARDVDPSWALRTLNKILTGGVMQQPGALRFFNSSKYRYATFEDVPAVLEELAVSVSGFLDLAHPAHADGFRVYADIHWKVNIHGHIFADACGRTAALFAIWAYWSRFASSPLLPGVAEYWKGASLTNFASFEPYFHSVCTHQTQAVPAPRKHEPGAGAFMFRALSIAQEDQARPND